MSRGRFITLEGIEGAGKTTVAQLVNDWLTARSIPVRMTREPGGTPLAERVRNIVLERGPEPLSAEAETLLMFAARSIHLENLIRPALAGGHWVICDRFTDATRAYQGSGRGVDAGWIEDLARRVLQGLVPDCTLLLDLPVEVGLARARRRSGVAADRFEAQHEEFFERVRAAYLEIARREPQRMHVIDASAPLEAVQQQVTAALESLLAGTAK
ncbi:MAG TPA: dTMP kinase [Steroidobacteraceae bacterium]|nr:dTMP kinase [Steroidobacteraceae bacterium]